MSRVNVSIVELTTVHANPSPYSQPVYSARAAERSARRTGDAGVSLIDDLNASAGVLAFVLQLRFEHSPAGIEHGLCHPCLNQFGAAHIANNYLLILINNLSGKLMQGIGSTSSSLAVNALCLLAVPVALRVGQTLRVSVGPSPCRQRVTIACRGDGLESKVDANSLERRDRDHFLLINWYAQPPVTARVLSKISALELLAIEACRFKNAKRLSCKPNSSALSLNPRAFKWHPPERTPRSCRNSPAKLLRFCQLSFERVFLRDGVDGVGGQVVATNCKASARVCEVVSTWCGKSIPNSGTAVLGAPIPLPVNFNRCSIEPCISFAFDLEPKCLDHARILS